MALAPTSQNSSAEDSSSKDPSASIEMEPNGNDNESSGSHGRAESRHIVVDSKSTVRTGASSEHKKKGGGTAKNCCILMFLALFVAADIYAAISYGSNGGCDDVEDNLTMSPSSYCLVAALTSAAMFCICAFAWWKQRQPEFQAPASKQNGKKPKQDDSCSSYCHGVLCITFWNIAWATLGIWMWISQFDASCRMTPIGIVILFWSCFQVNSV